MRAWFRGPEAQAPLSRPEDRQLCPPRLPPPPLQERETLAGSSKVRPGKGKKVPAEGAGRPCRQAHPTHGLGPVSEPSTGPDVGLSTQRGPPLLPATMSTCPGRAGARGTWGLQSKGARVRPGEWLLRREDPPSAQAPLPGAPRCPGSQARPVEGSMPRHRQRSLFFKTPWQCMCFIWCFELPRGCLHQVAGDLSSQSRKPLRT